MRNIDADLVKVIDERIKSFEDKIEEYLPRDKIESILNLLIKNRVEAIVVQKTTDLLNCKPQFLKDTIDALFNDDRYLEALKDSIKQNVCHELERGW